MKPRNPWLKKNPLLSLWLSAANAMFGAARGQATAAMKRTTKAAASAGKPTRKKATRRKSSGTRRTRG